MVSRRFPSLACRVSAAALALVVSALVVPRSPIAAQTVRGTVVNAQSGSPVPRARVQLDGSASSTNSDDAGRFAIGAMGDSVTLKVSALGFTPRTQRVGVGATAIRVELVPAPLSLSTVVVTGTAGATEARQVGNAVSKIDASQTMVDAPITDVSQLIRGRAAGALVQVGQGAVGTGGRIKLRGTSSLSLSDQPLIYVDGVRVDNTVATGPNNSAFGGQVSRLNDFAPEEIESIEIIKGPAASTLYGTEASNGVIQILTKRGRTGEAPRWSFTARGGSIWFRDAMNRIPTVYGKDAAGNILTVNPLQLAVNQTGASPYGVGKQQGYSLNVSGGMPAVQYFVSGEVDDDGGIEPSSHVRSVRTRANVEVRPNSIVQLSSNLAYLTGNTNLPADGSFGGATYALLNAQPSLLTNPVKLGWSFGSPAQNQTVWNFSEGTTRFTGGAQARVTPRGWLDAHIGLGLDNVSELNAQTTQRMSPDLAAVFGSNLASGRRDVSNRIATVVSLDGGTAASARLRPSTRLTTSVGVQYFHRATTTLTETGTGFPVPGLTTVSSGSTTKVGGESYLEDNTVGAFGQEEIALNDRLFVSGALRVDNNSAFGKDFKWITYPKFSVSWIATDEPFWKWSFLSSLKLRAAYGESGQQPRALTAVRTYEPVTGVGGVPAVAPLSYGNPDLKPERGKEWEVGMDGSLFGDRAVLQLTAYNKRTVDAIVQRNLPPSAGFPGQQPVNVGEISNRGLELMVDTHLFSRQNASLDLAVNYALNNSEVIHVGNAQGFISTGSQQHHEGYPVAAYFNKKVVSATYNATTKLAENILCDDGSGVGVPCASAPLVYNGRSTPNRFGSVTPRLKLFKLFELSALVDYQLGFNRENTAHWNSCLLNACSETFYPDRSNPIKVAEIQQFLTDDFAMSKADFAKLREISLSILFSQGIAKRFGASRGNLVISGTNLHTWTSFPGLDPEAFYVGQEYSGININVTPPLSTFLVKVNLNY